MHEDSIKCSPNRCDTFGVSFSIIIGRLRFSLTHSFLSFFPAFTFPLSFLLHRVNDYVWLHIHICTYIYTTMCILWFFAFECAFCSSSTMGPELIQVFDHCEFLATQPNEHTHREEHHIGYCKIHPRIYSTYMANGYLWVNLAILFVFDVILFDL